jgi:hypothetical protein
MDNLDNLEKQPAAPQSDANPELSELQAQCDSLRHVVFSLLVLVLIVCGSLDLFLLRQVKYVREELQGARPQITQMVAEYNKGTAPAIQNLIKQLTDFAHTHPDFTPTLAKYGISAASATTPAAPGKSAPVTTAPAPTATKAAPKK